MTKKVKVAFFADMLIEDFDGCARTIHQIIKRFPREIFDVVFFCGEPPIHEKSFEYFKVPTLTIPFNKSYKMALPAMANRRLNLRLKDFDPDVIHVSNPSSLGIFAVNYAKANDIPVMGIYHTHFITYAKYYLKSLPFLIPAIERFILSVTRKLYDRCDINYVPVQSVLDDLVAYGYRTDNCKLWARGMEHGIFNPEKKNDVWLKSITKNNKKNILFASRLVWEKNLQTLIDIYNLVDAQGLEYNFVIAGDGTATAAVKEKMPKAFFLGNLSHDELSKLYASSDLFLFPSDTETYGNVIIEAMASGVPVVAADGGGPSSIINHGQNGYLAKPHVASDYLEKINLVMSDDSLKEKFITNGLKYTEGLSWEKLTQDYFDDLILLSDTRKSNNG